jgi:uncharacterized membrane protein
VAVRRLLALLFSPPAVDHVAILNARAGITLFAVALICGLAWLHHRKSEPTARGREVGAALVTTVLLLLAAADSEIRSYWLVHLPPPFQPASQLAAAWVLAGAGIVWLGLYRRQEWIRVIGGLTLAAGAFLLLSTQLESAPASYRAILNGRAAAGLLTIGVLYALALAHRRLGEHVVNAQAQIAVLLTAASLFSLSWLTSEIDAFWSVRGAAHQWSMARAGTLTIAWAAVGSTIVWIGVTRTRRWIQGVGAFVLVVAVARLLQLELAAAPPGYIVLANTRLIASLFVIGLLYGLASLYRRANQSGAVGPDAILVVLANVLTIVFLTSEITAFWQLGDSPGMRNSSVDASSHFAREMMLSVTWAAYATALVVAGLRKRYAPIRYFAMALFAVTIVKVFAVDLANLDRIYRVLSIVGLGVMLLMSSYLYNRFRANPAR